MSISCSKNCVWYTDRLTEGPAAPLYSQLTRDKEDTTEDRDEHRFGIQRVGALLHPRFEHLKPMPLDDQNDLISTEPSLGRRVCAAGAIKLQRTNVDPHAARLERLVGRLDRPQEIAASVDVEDGRCNARGAKGASEGL